MPHPSLPQFLPLPIHVLNCIPISATRPCARPRSRASAQSNSGPWDTPAYSPPPSGLVAPSMLTDYRFQWGTCRKHTPPPPPPPKRATSRQGQLQTAVAATTLHVQRQFRHSCDAVGHGDMYTPQEMPQQQQQARSIRMMGGCPIHGQQPLSLMSRWGAGGGGGRGGGGGEGEGGGGDCNAKIAPLKHQCYLAATLQGRRLAMISDGFGSQCPHSHRQAPRKIERGRGRERNRQRDRVTTQDQLKQLFLSPVGPVFEAGCGRAAMAPRSPTKGAAA